MSITFCRFGLLSCGVIFIVSFCIWVYFIWSGSDDTAELPFLTLLSGFATAMYAFIYRGKKSGTYKKTTDYGSNERPETITQ